MLLNLIHIEDISDDRSILQRLGSLITPFHSELKVREGSLTEIKEKAQDYEDKILRHGWGRVLSFYEEDLLPAANRMPLSRNVWRLRYELGCRAADLRAFRKAGEGAIRSASTLIAEMARARFDEDEKENLRVRNQVREFLARALIKTAAWMKEQGRGADEAKAYELLDRIGRLTKEARNRYAGLLWDARDTRVPAISAYLQYLGDCRWKVDGDPRLSEMADFVSGRMVINEQVPREEISERLMLNHLALCSSGASASASRHVGIGYLRTDQPARALTYLRHAQSLNGKDSGVTTFYLAQALFQTGDFTESAETFEAAANQGYSRSRIASWQAMAHAKAGQWEKALQIFQLAEQGLGENVDTEFYLQWGRASFLMKKAEDAEQKFREALKHDRTSHQAAYGLAVCLEHMGRRSEALTALENMPAEARGFAPAFHFRGRLLEAEGRAPEAIDLYRQAVALSPADMQYLLSLGLALDDMGHAEEALPYLERLAEAQQGGAEVVRRVMLCYFKKGDQNRTRRWLKMLRAIAPDSQEVARMFERDLISQATEAFNTRRYRDAINRWEEALAIYYEDSRTSQRLALSLLYDAASRLKGDDVEGVWEQIEKAHGISPGPESQFLMGVSRLVNGDPAIANRHFASLLEANPDRADYKFFEALSAYFSGDESAAERLAVLDSFSGDSNISSLLAFLQVQLSALKNDFETAVARVKSWADDPDAIRNLGIERHLINQLAALCMIRGVRMKKHQMVRFFEGMNAKSEDGYWDFALALVKQHLATMVGIARAAEAEPAKIEECDAAYRALLERATERERMAILQNHSALLRFTVCRHIAIGDIGASLDVLGRLKNMPLPAQPEIEALGKVLAKRMDRPSREKAYALLHRDQDAAKEVWEAMLERDPDDELALHHLACLTWSRAYDEVMAERYEESIPFWREGLEWYQQLYKRESYWEGLREKGLQIGQTAAHPFNEDAFNTWRSEALYDRGRALLDLIFHILAGMDFANYGKATAGQQEFTRRIQIAKSWMNTIRESNLDD